MTTEEIKQRIKYLVEFGGLYEDPIDELRKQNRILSVIAAVGLAVLVVHVMHVF